MTAKEMARKSPRDALDEAIKVIGSQTALAAALNSAHRKRRKLIKTGHIYHWLRTNGIPAEYAPDVYAMTLALGSPVSCEQLRPDVNWQAVRG